MTARPIIEDVQLQSRDPAAGATGVHKKNFSVESKAWLLLERERHDQVIS